MGGVPTKHKTHGAVARRRSHHAKKPLNLIACAKCGSATKPHQYCPNCGFYKGKEVVDVLAKLSRREKKNREKEIKK